MPSAPKLTSRLELRDRLKVRYQSLVAAIELLEIELVPIPHSPKGKGLRHADVQKVMKHFKEKRQAK